MMKPALFLGMMVFSLKVFAVSITEEVKSSLSKTNPKATRIASQTLYVGRDIFTPKELAHSQTMVG